MEHNITVKDVDYWVNQGYDPVYHTLITKGDKITGYITKPDIVPVDRTLSRYKFLRRLSMAEKSQIYASEHPAVHVFLTELNMSSNVDLDLPEVREAVDMFVDYGYVAASRIDEILRDPEPAEVT